MPKETRQSFHKALNMCKACSFLTASLSHPESEETEPFSDRNHVQLQRGRDEVEQEGGDEEEW